MSLLFNNVELLGYNHQNNFFGESSLFYSSTKTISVRGYILDLTNTNGVKNIFNDVKALLLETTEFQDVVINNENFGRGKVKSFSVDTGNWVKYTQYDAEIEILNQVPIADINSKEFTGVNLSNFYLIKSFSENFSLNFDNQNKILGGEHSIDIEYDTNNTNINLIDLAKSLASILLSITASSPNIAEGNYNTRSNYKTTASENYNITTGKCGFRKKFSYSTLNTANNYSFVRSISVEINEEGIASATENCSIKAENNIPSLYENALNGYNQEIVGSKSRCDSVFDSYKSKFKIQRNLNTRFISKNVQVNKFNGTISYTITYDNDPKKENEYTIEYVNTIERDQNGVWTASENGTINGGIGKYNIAEQGWSTIKGGIAARVLNFYNAQATDKIGNTLQELNTSISRNPYDGNINYNYTYTDDPTIKDGSDEGIRKINIEKSDTGLLPISKAFIIPNNKFPVVQNRNLKKQGTFTLKADLKICTDGNNVRFNGYNYFQKTKSLVGSPNPPEAQDLYLESINYSSNEVDQTVTYEAIYKYS